LRRVVALLDLRYPPDEAFVDGLLCALSRRRDARVYLVVSRGVSRTRVHRHRGSICLCVLPARRGPGRLGAALRAFALLVWLKRRWGDVARVPLFVRNDPTYLIVTLLSRRLLGFRKVVYQNTFPHERLFRRSPKGVVGSWLLRLAVAHASEALVVSRGGEGRLRRLAPMKRITVIPMCVDDRFLIEPAERPAGELRVVYVGTHRPERSMETVFEGAEEALRRGARFRITSVGATPGEIERLARNASVSRLLASRGLVFLERVRRDRIPAVLSGHHAGLCLIPPRDVFVEASPTKLAEYMAAGLFVLASNGIPFQEEVVRESGAGMLVDFDRSCIADALVDIAARPDEVVRRGRNGPDYVRKALSYSRYEAALAEILW
jgi:glycosyltransferase involved in cell wall biosynthesis